MEVLAGEGDEKVKDDAAKIIERIETSSQTDLEKVKTSLGAGTTPKSAEMKLKAFIQKYQGTKAAAEARGLLEKAGE